MRLIVIPDIAQGDDPAEPARLKQVMSAHPLNLLVMEAARRAFFAADAPESPESDISWVIPQQWDMSLPVDQGRVLHANLGATIADGLRQELSRHPWLILSHGRFVTQTSQSLLDDVLAENHADVVAIQVSPQLRAHRERIRLTPQGDLVGCRRLYRDVAEPTPLTACRAHHVFIRPACAERLLSDGSVRSIEDVLARSQTLGLRIRSFAVAGTEIDLASSQGLLTLCGWMLNPARQSPAVSKFLHDRTNACAGISPQARMVGPILVGSGVQVEADAVVVGPTVLCKDSRVGPQALVDASVVGEGVAVPSDRRLTGACVLTRQQESGQTPADTSAGPASGRRVVAMYSGGEFRTWSRFSYARCFKRVADILMAAVVILLFAPIIPFIALAIRINSPGPIFYKDCRQGRHGRPFRCIKFRTMRVGAAEIQDKLRFVSEVDGPQFKINDDPRISGVGRFLRETCIDEIPQFFNVLAGQMSVVGPRPSPEAENTQCPSWRDARLSVRPGITGLWQVCRTRQPFKDFQEWIYYDTKYVRELSLRNDLWICIQTFRRLVSSFVEQF
jgi:lipopolysaccharide/colanic/teichoic acid biosynthesis glycosyltransferase